LADEIAYEIVFSGEISNTYGDKSTEQTFEVQIRNYCYQRGTMSINEADLTSTIDLFIDGSGTYSLYTSEDTIKDSSYPTCGEITIDTSDCDTFFGEALTFVAATGSLTVPASETEGSCSVTLSLTSSSDSSLGTIGNAVTVDTATINVSVTGTDCTITLIYDTSDSITHYVGTTPITQDLGVTLVNNLLTTNSKYALKIFYSK